MKANEASTKRESSLIEAQDERKMNEEHTRINREANLKERESRGFSGMSAWYSLKSADICCLFFISYWNAILNEYFPIK